MERISSQRLGRPGPSDTSPRSEDVKQAALEKLQRRIQPPPANDPYVGRELGPFKVEEYLGGDRGERRYLALHEEQKVFAYLRVFPLTGSYGDEFKRLAGRGERACRVDHAHLEACLGAGRTKEAFFVGTEPPYGETLAEVIVREGPLGEDAALELLEQALGGLRTLHARDYAHAHISPLTIRREAPGRWVLCETGLARSRAAFSFLAAGGDVVGYPGYVAPETVDSGKPTKESDLYSLGCALWCALRGTPPFTGDDEVQILLDQLNREVPSLSEGLPETGGPEFSQGLVTILGKLTGYTPNVRYGSAGDVASDLRALKKGDPVAPFPSELAQQDDEPEGKAVSTGSTLALVLLLANALLAAWLGLTWLGSRQLQAVDPFEGFSFPLEADSEGEGE